MGGCFTEKTFKQTLKWQEQKTFLSLEGEGTLFNTEVETSIKIYNITNALSLYTMLLCTYKTDKFIHDFYILFFLITYCI